MSPWRHAIPRRDPEGRPIVSGYISQEQAEMAQPPSAQAQRACAAAADGWCFDGATQYYRDGNLWGRWADNHWTWLGEQNQQWWLWNSPQNPPILWHQGHWWQQNNGVWFLLHDGQPWGYLYLRDWNSAGLVNSSGVKVIYSSDGSRIAVVTPQEGAKLYDASSGKVLAQWSEEELPKRRQPHLPLNPVFD